MGFKPLKIAYLELAEGTELDTLSSTMETFVNLYAEELLPIATQLTSRLVRPRFDTYPPYSHTDHQATTYMRYVQEVIQFEEKEDPSAESLEANETKMFTLAAILKTIGTVRSIEWRCLRDGSNIFGRLSLPWIALQRSPPNCSKFSSQSF